MKTEAELFENALDTTSVNGKKLREYINENYTSNSVLDEIRAEINSPNRGICDYFIVDRIEDIIDKYMEKSESQESDIEKRKPCINCEDGCEEWAGCPCVHYKAESEE